MHFFMRRGLAEVCPELAPVSASCLRALTLLSGGVPSGGIARKRSKPFLPTSRLVAPSCGESREVARPTLKSGFSEAGAVRPSAQGRRGSRCSFGPAWPDFSTCFLRNR